MKWKITILILIVLVAVGTTVYLRSSPAEGADKSPTISNNEVIVISPQNARTSVTINLVTLTQGGYVVVRGSDGKRLGQVIEITPYLEAGEHKSITIELGDFYTYNEADQLIAMIYHDDGDKSFSDLDQPATSNSNRPIAVFVKTGEPVPPSVMEEQVATHGGMGMETVRYTNNGFQPAKLTVPVGTMVEFINQSDKEMWVASNVHPSHEILPTFDQFKGVEKGKSYMYTFDAKGTWAYHDHINPAIEGTITVE